MRLSTRGHYGLKAMFDLACQYGNGPVNLKSVARRQNISEPYLEQLIAVLRKAGLVESVRGAQGGYMLSKSPGEIRAGDVVRILEGPIAPLECLNENNRVSCDQDDICIYHAVWAKVKDAISGVLDSMTLSDMCREAGKIQHGECAQKNGH